MLWIAGLLAGHILLSRQLVSSRTPQATAAQLHNNITMLINQKGDKLAGLLAEALTLSLQHDVPYTAFFITQLASLCSRDLLGSKQQAAAEGQQAGREGRGQAMLQVLVQVAPAGAALAGLMLQVSIPELCSLPRSHCSFIHSTCMIQ